MRLIFLVFFVPVFLFSCSVKKHVSKKLIEIKDRKDIYNDIPAVDVDTSTVDFSNLTDAYLDKIFYYAVRKSLRRRDTIYTSQLLTNFGKITSGYFGKRKFEEIKYDKINRVYSRALPYFNTHFGMLYKHSFSLSVSPFRGAPYFDENDSRSVFNLYVGSKEEKNKSKPIPLFNEKQFSELIQKELAKIDFIRENTISSFSYVGYSYKIEQVKKGDIPKIRFFVYFGGKRLKMLEEKTKNHKL